MSISDEKLLSKGFTQSVNLKSAKWVSKEPKRSFVGKQAQWSEKVTFAELGVNTLKVGEQAVQQRTSQLKKGVQFEDGNRSLTLCRSEIYRTANLTTVLERIVVSNEFSHSKKGSSEDDLSEKIKNKYIQAYKLP